MKTKLMLFAVVGLTIAVFTACEKETNQSSSNKVNLTIHLTDAPAEYDAVLIDIQDVLINRSGEDQGWTSLENIEKGIYNLLDLTGGVDTLIATAELDTGLVSQIRLVLGENNSLVIDEDTLALNTPSAQQSGLKIKINQHFNAGVNYKILLDFDAAKSVVKAGNSGKYNLKPVIRTIVEALDGGISGTVADSVRAVVYAIKDNDSAASYTDNKGFFMVQGLEEGIYSLAISPEEGWSDTTIYGISVFTGSITGLGEIEISTEK